MLYNIDNNENIHNPNISIENTLNFKFQNWKNKLSARY